MLANGIEIAAALTNFEPHVLALHPAQLRQRLQEYRDPCLRVGTKSACKHPNRTQDLWPLSLRDNRPPSRRAAEQRDKIAPPHGLSPAPKTGTRIKYSRWGAVHRSKTGHSLSGLGHSRPRSLNGRHRACPLRPESGQIARHLATSAKFRFCCRSRRSGKPPLAPCYRLSLPL